MQWREQAEIDVHGLEGVGLGIAGDVAEQRAWANRMARRAGGTDDKLDSQEDWEWLLEDMLKLCGSEDSGLKGAFCLLKRDEVTRIFLSGVLAAGREGSLYDIS